MAYAPIINPVYLDATPWPYIRGPNYTRPVFAEHSRRGNFVANPIIRMPRLDGLGGDPQWPLRGLGELTVPYQCWDVSGFKECHDKALVDAQKIGANVFEAGTANYDKLVNNMRDAHVAQRCIPICSQAMAAQPTTPVVGTPFVGPAAPPPGSSAQKTTPWYLNPWYIGAGLVLGVVVAMLAKRGDE